MNGRGKEKGREEEREREREKERGIETERVIKTRFAKKDGQRKHKERWFVNFLLPCIFKYGKVYSVASCIKNYVT